MNNTNNILEKFYSKKGQIAILVDPEKTSDEKTIIELIKKAEFAKIDYFFIGGSTVSKNEFDTTINLFFENTQIPIVIFPGSSNQISEKAEAILFLSLISGRNPDFLIGHHVQAALELYNSKIEVIPTAYILIDGGNKSSVAYISQTSPIPRDKINIAYQTALAGILQGKEIVFFDAGSGALNNVPLELVKSTNEFKHPIIVGGGIKSIDLIEKYKENGANIIVIGNHIENNINFLLDIKNYKEIIQ